MNDREMLEWAAKAAGLKEYGWMADTLTHVVNNQFVFWEPLTDDGDALRLANRLCMSVSTGPCEATANTISGALRGQFFKEDTVNQDHDHAVRRAIVRAAAELGKAKP